MKLLTILISGLILIDFAHADWVCNDHNSELNDDGEITICGQSTDNTVDAAKKWSFHEAHMEFWRLCMASNTCKGYEVSIVPERMDCVEKPFNGLIYKSRWTCKRSVRFIIDRSGHKCDETGRDMFKGCPMNRMPFDGV